MVYIRQYQLSNLKDYRYAGVDLSLISRYVLKPFYNNIVIKCFPMSMAPNAITLTGLFFVLINFFTVLYYNPTFDKDCPPWVYASCAIGLFLYQTFDGVDGIQARRTKQSGPLGELFDHSVDACNTALGVIVFAAVMNLGQSWATILTLFGSTMTFYVQTWDMYYTQVLTLGIISGPVEGVLTLCVVFGFTAYMGGGSFWHQPMLETVGVPKLGFVPAQLYDMPFTQWYLIYGGIMLFFATGSSIAHVVQVRKERGKDPLQPLYGLLPLVLTWALVPAYLYLNPAILENYIVPFALYIGLVNAYSVGRMICAHLVKAEFPYSNILLGPLALAVVDSAGALFGLWSNTLIGTIGQPAFVFLCLGLGLGIYGSFVPQTGRLGAPSRIRFNLRHLHETSPVAFTPQAGHLISAPSQLSSLIDFFVSSRWFSRSTFSTPLLRLRPASTSLSNLCLLLVPSSWTSSAPAASTSPPSSLTPRPSLCAPAALPSSANPPVVRPASPRAALSAESKRLDNGVGR